MKLGAYSGDTITLTLPMGMTWNDVTYLSIWCKVATANFGHVLIADDMFLPPFIPIEMVSFCICAYVSHSIIPCNDILIQKERCPQCMLMYILFLICAKVIMTLC